MAGYDSNKGKGKILKRADPSTIQDKFLVGYQGWFTCAGDGEPIGSGHHGWLHWFDRPIPDGGRPNVDLWPDVTGYSPSELFPAPGLQTASGEQIFLFSSRHPKTVQRHFHLMAEHGIDGAFLQRFASQCDLEAGNTGIMKIRDEVGDLVRDAAEKEGRVFAIMYDVSGVPADRIQKVLERDWVHLIRNKGVLDSPNYLREKGKAVVAVWGLGFQGAGHTPAQVRAITTYIRHMTPGGAYILAGAPAHWRTAESDADRNAEFLDVWLNEFDAISPWTVGRYQNEQDADQFAAANMKRDVELIKKRNEEGRWRKIDYMPVVFPGGSGYNLTQGRWGLNSIKRNGGRFLWQQIFNAKRQGVTTIYGAMWDEYDEGTALMPAVEKKRMLPQSDKHVFMALDEDGYDLPSDWYMRICGFAAEGLRSERRIHETFPSKELQDYWASRPKYEEVDHKSGDFVSGGSKEDGYSTGEGKSYQEWLATQKDDKDEPPPPPYSLEAEEIIVNEPLRSISMSSTASTVSPPQSTSGSVSSMAHASASVSIPVNTRIVSPPPAASLTTHEQANLQNSPLSSSGPVRQTTAPPPVNASSRPKPSQQNTRLQSPTSSTSRQDSSITTQHTSYAYNDSASESYSGPQSHGSAGRDPVSSLAHDFSRQEIGSSTAHSGRTSMPSPPLHPADPTTQGPRPHSSNSRPQPRPQSQAGHHQPSSPTSSSHPSQVQPAQPGGSWSQAQWPPPEWGQSGSRSETWPSMHQSMYPGRNTNLSPPQTTPGPRPHSSLGVHSPVTSSPAPYMPSGAPPLSDAPNHYPGGPSYGSGAPYFPSAQGGGSLYPPTSYPERITSPFYGGSNYAPPGPGYGSAPQISSSHSTSSLPGPPYYPSQTPSHSFPSNNVSYPGQTSYGPASQSPFGAPHDIGYSASGVPQVGGFHVPQSPSGDSHYNSYQSSSSGYAPSYINQPSSSSPYGGPQQSGWYPGSIAPPPIHPHQSHAPYSTASSSGPSFPMTGRGVLGSALNTVDKVAGKKARDQLESAAQSGTKLFNKLTR